MYMWSALRANSRRIKNVHGGDPRMVVRKHDYCAVLSTMNSLQSSGSVSDIMLPFKFVNGNINSLLLMGKVRFHVLGHRTRTTATFRQTHTDATFVLGMLTNAISTFSVAREIFFYAAVGRSFIA